MAGETFGAAVRRQRAFSLRLLAETLRTLHRYLPGLLGLAAILYAPRILIPALWVFFPQRELLWAEVVVPGPVAPATVSYRHLRHLDGQEESEEVVDVFA